MDQSLNIDTVQLEVFHNRFQAIVEEMASLILRSAHTVFVKETSDFGPALVSTEGEVFAAPVNTGVALMVGVPCDVAIEESKKLGIEPGDIFISNDVWNTGGMATHLPDIYVWKPIFHDGEIIAYSWAFIHSSDVGGKVPGSISPSSEETYQEGLRIPVSKLFEAGELNEELLDVIRSNSRIPDQNWGDIKAMVSGLNTAEERVDSLADRYSGSTVRDAADDLLNYGEQQAREEFDKIPDGEYEFWDYLEADSGGGRPIRLKVTMKIEGSDIIMDFQDTDPQTRQSYNLPSHERQGHWQFVFSLIGYLKSVRSNIVYNSGLGRPVKLQIPDGSVLNPEPGVSVGNRSATQIRLVDVVMGALAQAQPDLVPAAGGGQGSIMLIRVPNLETGGSNVTVIQPLSGGSGGRPSQDGIDGIEFSIGYLRNIPVESIESDIGVRFNHYRLRPDSGGAGRYRGGAGVEVEFKLLEPEATITSRAMDRYIFHPWGRLGGKPGSRGYTELNPEADGDSDIGKIDVLDLEGGDVLSVATPGGGGYGDPLERDPQKVLRDINQGLISSSDAREDYGVVLTDDGAIDYKATEAARTDLRDQQNEKSAFDFGAARYRYEEVWSDEFVSELNRLLRSHPPQLQTFLRERICEEIEDAIEEDDTPDTDDLRALYNRVTTELEIE